MHTSIHKYLVYGIYKLRSEEGMVLFAVCCACVCGGGGSLVGGVVDWWGMITGRHGTVTVWGFYGYGR